MRLAVCGGGSWPRESQPGRHRNRLKRLVESVFFVRFIIELVRDPDAFFVCEEHAGERAPGVTRDAAKAFSGKTTRRCPSARTKLHAEANGVIGVGALSAFENHGQLLVGEVVAPNLEGQFGACG